MSGCTINLRCLDVLRGLLATYVLLGHCRWLLWCGHTEWLASSPAPWELPIGYASALFRFGHEAVIVFFVLSGFFIHLRSARQLISGRIPRYSAWKFYRRRWHRLAAPYYTALLLTCVLDLLGRYWFPNLYFGQSGDALLDSNFARKDFSPAAVFPGLLLLPSTLGKDFGSNGPLWSIAFEAVFYLAYPIWLRIRCFGLLPSVGIGCLTSAAGMIFGNGSAFAQIAILYPLWLAGAFLAEAVIRGNSRMPGWGALLLLIPASCLMVSGIAATPLITTLILNMIGALAIVAVAVYSPPVWMEQSLFRAFEYLGVRSYTLYIVHFPIIVLMCAIFIQVNGTRPVHGWYALGGASIAIILSLGIYHLVERKFSHSRLRLDPHDA